MLCHCLLALKPIEQIVVNFVNICMYISINKIEKEIKTNLFSIHYFFVKLTINHLSLPPKFF